MSPLELRTVLKHVMEQRRDKVLPRPGTTEPANIEIVRGPDQYAHLVSSLSSYW